MVKICFTKSESQKKKKKRKKFDENQATMGNYISKPNTLTNKENLLMKKNKVFSGSCRTLQQCLFDDKICFRFSSPQKFTHFSDSNSRENNGLRTKTTIKRTTSKQNKWPIWMKRNCLFLNF